MTEGKQDHILIMWPPPFWPVPGMLVLKSGQMGRWTAIFTWVTDVAPGGCFIWWLQFRAWWPPVSFFRGWVRDDN